MDLYTTSPDIDNALVNPASWADEQGIHEQLRWLRLNNPVPWLEPQGLDEMIQAMTGRKHIIRSLVQMDDPDHMKYRMLTQSWFMGTNASCRAGSTSWRKCMSIVWRIWAGEGRGVVCR